MKPIEFPTCNSTILLEHYGETLEVPYRTDGMVTAFCWELTDEDIERLKESKKLWVVAHRDYYSVPVLGLEKPWTGRPLPEANKTLGGKPPSMKEEEGTR